MRASGTRRSAPRSAALTQRTYHLLVSAVAPCGRRAARLLAQPPRTPTPAGGTPPLAESRRTSPLSCAPTLLLHSARAASHITGERAGAEEQQKAAGVLATGHVPRMAAACLRAVRSSR